MSVLTTWINLPSRPLVLGLRDVKELRVTTEGSMVQMKEYVYGVILDWVIIILGKFFSYEDLHS